MKVQLKVRQRLRLPLQQQRKVRRVKERRALPNLTIPRTPWSMSSPAQDRYASYLYANVSRMHWNLSWGRLSHACGFMVTKSPIALMTCTAVLQPGMSVATAPSVAYSLQSTMAHLLMFTLTTGMDARKECSPDKAATS